MTTDTTDPLGQAESVIGDLAIVLSEGVGEVTDKDEVLSIRGRLEDLLYTLRYAIAEVDKQVIALHPWNETHDAEGHSIPILIPGGGIGKIGGGKTAKRYDIPMLKSALTDAIVKTTDAQAVIDGNGEPCEVDSFVQGIVDATIDAAGADAPSFTNYRSTVLRRYGINLKQYATETEASPLTFRIEGRGKEGL